MLEILYICIRRRSVGAALAWENRSFDISRHIYVCVLSIYIYILMKFRIKVRVALGSRSNRFFHILKYTRTLINIPLPVNDLHSGPGSQRIRRLLLQRKKATCLPLFSRNDYQFFQSDSRFMRQSFLELPSGWFFSFPFHGIGLIFMCIVDLITRG